jgi:predicted aspartyl protease
LLRHWNFHSATFFFLTITFAWHLSAQELTQVPAVSVLPFELDSGFLVVVQGELGDLKGLRFLVDTGSTHSVIDRAVANKLHLKKERYTAKIMSFGDNISIERAEVTGLRVGPIRLNRTQILVTSLARYSEFAKNVDGIIGLDLLARSNQLTIDYEKKTLSFQAIADVGDRPVPYSFQMPIVIQGVPMLVVVDTGFQGILLYADRFHKRLPNIHIDGKPKSVAIGRIQAIELRLPGVQIAAPETVAAVWLMDDPRTDLTPTIDGILGPACLHATRVEFDFSAKRLRWQPQDAERDR